MNLANHPLLRAVDNGVDEQASALVVGVSGGADSVALLRAVVMRRPGLRLVVAHLDHGLRPQSASDAAWVERLAASHNLSAVVDRQDVARAAVDAAIGTEEAARRCRYEFLSRTAANCDCPFIAIAHTTDDQAETVLHQLLRGTGLAGLRGMPASRRLQQATLVRPLLSVSRADVLDFLERLEQPFLEDETNAEEAFTRNRIRHSLLPLLREQFNPQVDTALVRLAQQAQEVQSLIDELTADLLAATVAERTPACVRVRVAPLTGANRHLVREMFRLLFTSQDWPRQRMGFDAWNELAELAQSSQAPKSLTLPEGIVAHYRRGIVTIERG